MAAVTIDELAALIRARLDHLEALARDAVDEPWLLQDGYDGPGIKVGETDGWFRMGEATSAAYRCNDPLDDCDSVRASYRAEGQLIVACAEPAAVLREVAAKRALLDRLLAEPHERFEEDHWYSCGALKDSDGTYLCYNDSRVGECTCDRDARVRAYLELLAQPYQETT